MKRFLLLLGSLGVIMCGLGWPIASQAQVWKRLQKKIEEAARQKAQEQAAEEAEEAMTGDADAVADFRKLKALLPEQAAGLPRVRAEGAREGAFGIKTARAEGVYEAGDRRIRIQITDPGTLQGLATMGYSWLQTEIDREDEDGYERTLTLDGRRAYERFTQYEGGSRAELSTIVADRFIVSLEGENVPVERLREVLRRMDLEALEQLAQELQGAAAAELTDFRVLKDMLPEAIDGLTRVEASGERTAAMGMRVSQATATYRDGQREVRLTIRDMGSMQHFMGVAAAWLRQEIDRENERGYERTTRYQGYPAYEKFERLDGNQMHAQLQVVVRDRYLIEVEGTNVSMDVLWAALDQIDLRRLK
ncbi:hypothetical protein [Rhodothermus profundi]|uniref:Uncharacterized protein n=1 Tax=Rhodothermus profundi TaxID=633813 RepID=A0A1M6Q042_9BACT|nr:hypothetical protein [Rhodothermus profundi]SHK13517.1 hypothetical protein SAMN04488087_0406 [Rhodothermus profundi]